MSGAVLNYTAAPTLAAFMRSRSFTRWILGPVGSGKSAGMIMELMRRAAEQQPGPDGIRRTRFAVIRNTLQQLRQTVLKEVETWLGPIMRWRVTDNTVFIEVGDIRSEWFLIPLDDPLDVKRLLSMQLTGAYINEFSEVDPAIIPALAGRCGRYPSAIQGGASWYGIIGDSNMPTIGGEWHRLLELDRPPDWDVYIQPGGLDPEAENIANLPGERDYYTRLAAQHSEDWVRRYVFAQYGDDPSGTAVYKTSFKRLIHAADSIEVVPGHTLFVGQDFGRNPCAVICQINHRGRFNALEEVVSEDIGLELHLTSKLRVALSDPRYLGLPIAVIGDPAGRSKDSLYEETSFDLIRRHGFSAYPAPTNEIDARLRGVEALLLQADGFQVDASRCPQLIRGLAGGYRFGKMKDGTTKPVPEKKNPVSDLQDALQYAASSANAGLRGSIMRRLMRDRAPRQPTRQVSARAWT